MQRHAVHILDMKVTFGDGSVRDVELRAVIPAGGASRVIDLPGNDRIVKRVDFTYEANSIGRGNRAHIRLFGQR